MEIAARINTVLPAVTARANPNGSAARRAQLRKPKEDNDMTISHTNDMNLPIDVDRQDIFAAAFLLPHVEEWDF
ncbi:hypothetical protein [Ancylobacter oerskovii]|uniref:hypothetical protein n=1 Tax=Ancylobacter oerskovii TaxID=459519 RepID=UPI001BCB081A|nr:hypothetical protein [Ancylobacter oerskovii]MBS7545250.1 hypothetical protein [Ancylobacter oerskovii]